MKKKKIVIFGATGFLGRVLSDYLAKVGYKIVGIARNTPDNYSHDFVQWDAKHYGAWNIELEDADAIINLCGRSVDCKKTEKNCFEILQSRIITTRLIGKALKKIEHKPECWIQMSTAHLYGDYADKVCHEGTEDGEGFAPMVGRAWEDCFSVYLPEGVRPIIMRTSFVLGRNGGALMKLKRIAKLGLAGKVGDGKQGISWMHEDDFKLFVHEAIVNPSFFGIYNLTAPKPVSNYEFMKKLRKTLGVPIGLPGPELAVWLASALVFNTDHELVTKGRYVIPKRLLESNFEFQFEKIELALIDLLTQKRNQNTGSNSATDNSTDITAHAIL